MDKSTGKISKKGFTVIELLVAMAVFSMMMGVVVSTYMSIVKVHRKSINVQRIQDDGKYISEKIFREIRMSGITTDEGFNTTLDIKHNDLGTINYRFQNNILERKYNAGWRKMNSDNTVVTGQFYIKKTGAHPRVTIFFTVSSNERGFSESVHFQTTVSSRSY